MAIAVCVYCSRFKVRYSLANTTFGTAHGGFRIITLPTKFLEGQIHPDEDIFDGCCKHGSIDRGNIILAKKCFLDLKLLGNLTKNQRDLFPV